MHIVDVRVTPVSIGLTRSAAMAHGSPQDRVTRSIVEVELDTGLVGLGETAAGPRTEMIADEFGPAIRGLDARDLRAIRRHCLPDALDYGTPVLLLEREAFGGLEVALWDVLGKSLGYPIYRMLGGLARNAAPFVAYAYPVVAGPDLDESRVPEKMAEYAATSIERSGAKIFEFKIGRNSLECDIATVFAVREAVGPHVNLAIDANMGLSIDEARAFLATVAPAGIANFEEPVADLASMAALRREFNVPVSTHCTDLDALRAHPEIDASVFAIDTQGGIAASLALIQSLHAIGKRCWLRSYVETGVLWAAMVHLGIACPLLDRPGQALIETLEDDLIEGDVWHVRDGGVVPPDSPGLGVSLDVSSVARHHDAFKRLGTAKDFTPPLSHGAGENAVEGRAREVTALGERN
jgi:glucarate dehydratase